MLPGPLISSPCWVSSTFWKERRCLPTVGGFPDTWVQRWGLRLPPYETSPSQSAARGLGRAVTLAQPMAYPHGTCPDKTMVSSLRLESACRRNTSVKVHNTNISIAVWKMKETQQGIFSFYITLLSFSLHRDTVQ